MMVSGGISSVIEKKRGMTTGLARDLCNYINGGCLTRWDKVVSVFIPALPFIYNARNLVARYQAAARPLAVSPAGKEIIRVEKYEGTNEYVIEMMIFLDKYLRHDLTGAYVHGSLGAYDEVAYSDFDGLVILSAGAFASAGTLRRVGRKLNEARKIMLNYDPLQHHGWFVLTDADLHAYPADYFPPVLFSHAKALLGDRGLELAISARADKGYNEDNFSDLANAVISKALRGPHPGNLYELKGFLSEAMLLPALYVQARDGAGIYKKDSFGQAERDFTSEDWAVMSQVSRMRSGWHYEIEGFRRRLLTIHHPTLRKWLTRKCSPGIPRNLEQQLTASFYSRVAGLTEKMREKLRTGRQTATPQ